jgi:hypothetical protein
MDEAIALDLKWQADTADAVGPRSSDGGSHLLGRYTARRPVPQDRRSARRADGQLLGLQRGDLDEHLSAMHTRVCVNRLCPQAGDHRRPIL